MTNYSPKWDLSTIPEPEWQSEHGRRRRLKGPQVTNANLKPCSRCSQPLTASQRRKACPTCGWRNDYRRREPDGTWRIDPNIYYPTEETSK